MQEQTLQENPTFEECFNHLYINYNKHTSRFDSIKFYNNSMLYEEN